jgi:para-nitrobenzyl esterase
MRTLAFIATSIAFFACSNADATITEAQVTGGEIRGVEDDGVASFKGIPFADPPIGPLRWKPPQKPMSWRGQKRADAFALPCTQAVRPPPASGEDCLYLNVWTSARTRSDKRPVMVWIHGGSLTSGAPSLPVYDGTQFARDGIVLVTMAYRLGAFGFVAHPELSRESGQGSGAYGFMDQIAALEWVRSNIAGFGGDPSRVTVFGESAGAWSVSVLASSARAKGLFHRVIAQSGAIFAPARTTSTPTEPFQNLLSLPVAESNGIALLAALDVASIAHARDKSAADVLAAADRSTHETLAVIDGEVMRDENIRLFETRRFNDVPLLLGHTSGEAIGHAPPEVTPEAIDAAAQMPPCPAEAAKWLSLYSHRTVDEAVAAMEESQRDAEFGWPAWRWGNCRPATATRQRMLITSTSARVNHPEAPHISRMCPMSSVPRMPATMRARSSYVAIGSTSRSKAIRTIWLPTPGRHSTRNPRWRWSSTTTAARDLYPTWNASEHSMPW